MTKDLKKTRNAKQLSLFVPSPSQPSTVTVSIAASVPATPSSSSFLNLNHNTTETPTRSPSRTLSTSPSLSSLSVTTPIALKSFSSTPSLSSSNTPTTPSSFASRRRFTPAPLSSASLVSSSKKHTLQLDGLPTSLPQVAQTPTLKSSFLLPPPTRPSSSSQQPAHRSISAYFSDYSVECGVASPYTTEPVRVLPHLYLGAEHNASDLPALSRLGISSVLNVALEITRDGEQVIKTNNSHNITTTPKSNLSSSVFRHGVEYKNLSWSHSQHNIQHDFAAAFEFIDQSVAQGGKVLIHCQLGVSRSASLVIAYVMRAQGMGLSEAYDFVKQLSAVISPNMTLMYQLAEFEKSLKGNKDVYMGEENEDDDIREKYVGLGPDHALDDEPPYPFADMSMDPATVPSSLPPATPMRQEFFSRRVPESSPSDDDHVVKPVSRPRHTRTPSGSSKRNSIVHSQPHNTPISSPNLLVLPSSRSRPTPYRRSPLTTVTNVHSPKTPTTDKFSRLSLSSSSEHNNNDHCNRSVHSDIEMMAMVDPPSPAITAPSTPNLHLCSTTSSSASSFVVIPSSRPPSTSSSVCSFVPSMMTLPRLQPFGSSSSSESEDTEEEEEEDDDEKNDKDVCSPRNSWTFVPVVQGSQKWAGVSHVDGPTGSDLGAVAAKLSGHHHRLQPVTKGKNMVFRARSSSTPVAVSASLSEQKEPVAKPECIFSPRPYKTFRRHERSFGEFYQALMGRID
ncbi:hypothetical protein BGZ59_003786 [Podila verticillata]|nr:hypothetical protein BGZ59_003786 [Podila verticillata]